MAKTARKASVKTAAKSSSKPAKKKVAKAVAVKETQPSKIKIFKEPLTKTKLLQTITENTSVAKKDVTAVVESLSEIINAHVKPKAAGKLNFFGLFVIEVRTKPAVKARKGINPFSGEEMMFKAKPARKVVKIKPLKKLKEMVEA